jgi:FdhD protein
MSSKDFLAWRLDGDAFAETPERVVEEGPLSVRVNDQAFTVTLRTPGDDRALVMGLLFSEGIVETPDDLLTLQEEPRDGSQEANARDGAAVWSASVRPRAALSSKLSNRSLASTSSCGFCGKTEWEDPAALCVTEGDAVSTEPVITTTFLETCFRAMRERQDLFGQTGGSHAAAVFSANGTLLGFGEDAGRHNAVDKAVGRLWEAGQLVAATVLCVSGRVSYEIASKAARAGMTVLAAVSAPSSMAVTYCRENNITLIGFCRGTRATVYTHPERVAAASGALDTEKIA